MTDEDRSVPETEKAGAESSQESRNWEREEWLRELESGRKNEDVTAPLPSAAEAWMEAEPLPKVEQPEKPEETPEESGPASLGWSLIPDVPMPPEEKLRGDGKSHRTGRERRMDHRDVVKTPAYYDGPGKNEPFKVNFDFQRAYCDPVKDHPIRHTNIRHTGWMGGLMYFLFVMCVSVTAACIVWLAATDVLALGKTDKVVEVTVPENFTMEEVSENLFTAGIIKYEKLFKLYGKISHAEDKIDPGTYQIHTNYDYRALVHGMTEDDGEMIEVDVLVPEGYSMDEIAALLESEGVCTREKFMDCAANTVFEYDFLSAETGDPYRLEGYLFPDTYKFYLNDDPQRVIEKFLTDFDLRFNDEMLGRAEVMGRSIGEILTVASIIEEEAGNDSERALIASVIYNRLAAGSALQMDSTVNYAIARLGQTVFDTNVDSPYNTYLYAGLPAGAISNPGLASIEAALYPEETGYQYFGVNVEGNTVFFEDYDSFTEFVNSDQYGG